MTKMLEVVIFPKNNDLRDLLTVSCDCDCDLPSHLSRFRVLKRR